MLTTKCAAIGHPSQPLFCPTYTPPTKKPSDVFAAWPMHFKEFLLALVEELGMGVVAAQRLARRAMTIWQLITKRSELTGYPFDSYQQEIREQAHDLSHKPFARLSPYRITLTAQTINLDGFGNCPFTLLNALYQSTGSSPVEVVFTQGSLSTIKKVLICALCNERAFLVGPTGEGKTTLVQQVAKLFGKKLFVYNMNQGSDSVDLVGGFKPLDAQALAINLANEFIALFKKLP